MNPERGQTQPPRGPIDPLLRSRRRAPSHAPNAGASRPSVEQTTAGGGPTSTRLNGVIVVLASALGLWLGVSAPSVSPVTPAIPAAVRQTAIAGAPRPTAPAYAAVRADAVE